MVIRIIIIQYNAVLPNAAFDRQIVSNSVKFSNHIHKWTVSVEKVNKIEVHKDNKQWI